MTTVTISREIRTAAAPATVWWVLATPSQQPVIDARVQVVNEWGEAGAVGSGYELAVPRRPVMRLQVVDALPGERHLVSVAWEGRTRGAQDARLVPDGTGCVLTYTMSIDVPRVLAPIQRWYGMKQLGEWLDAVARVSSQADPDKGTA